MKKIILSCTLAIFLIGLPATAARKLPAGAGISYAMAYYKQHVIAGETCAATVGINARNKSAILEAAMPGYAAATSFAGKADVFPAYFAAVTHSTDRCQSAVAGLPRSIVNRITRSLRISDQAASQQACPVLEYSQKQAYEIYLEALTAKAVWDAVGKQC